jgi:outer membrane protein assembly factor BamD (BamD/ComL family)
MGKLITLVLAIAVMTAVVFFFFLRNKKRSSLLGLYHEAIIHENKGDYAGAIEIYELLLEQSRNDSFPDARLLQQIEHRLKTLRSKWEYENGFVAMA